MCGVAGFLDRRGSAAGSAAIDALVDSMLHRGPDGEGRCEHERLALGMRRLAILDLEKGSQPFATPDGRVIAFANCEIYNHRRLREELAREGVRFHTGCDAEVLPHAFRRWGMEGMLQRLDGMFAIAILDRATGRLHLARDRFGEKPLFYRDEAGHFAFASQLASLCLIEPESLRVDGVALRHYLGLHFVPGPRTLFEGIRKLPPGHRLELDLEGGGPSLHDWRTPLEAPGLRRYEDAVERLRALIGESVESRLVADVPVGVFLSGGVDSSAIAAAAARVAPRVETFSIGFEDGELDESEHARAVARHIGSVHHHFAFDLEACLEVLDEAVEALDGPLGDPACLPVHLLARHSRRHVKVVLSGEGADELFAGYDYYPTRGPEAARRSLRAWWKNRGRRPDPRPLFRADATTASGFPMLTTEEERERFAPGAASTGEPWQEEIEGLLAAERCPLRRAQRADLETWLPDDLLPKFDRMTMAASLEGRAPFLEPRIAALGLHAPAEWKTQGRERKRLLRDAVSPWLPDGIFSRPKQGFVLPMQRWLAGPLRERLLDGLASQRDDGLAAEPLRRMVEADLARGATRARLLYALLAYREWWSALKQGRTLAQRDAGSRVESDLAVHARAPRPS